MKNNLPEKLAQFRWLWRKHRHRRYATDGALTDASSGQGRILALLKIQDGVSTKDMSYLFGVHTSTLNDMLLKLEKGGYIKREPSANDKRVIVVKITDKGSAVELPNSTAENGIFTSVLNDAEQREFCRYLDRLIAALQNELGIDGAEMQNRIQYWKDRENS